ncbi:MAG: hypothetical protein AAE983_01690 [Thermoplasmataceae archaeon]|jgi:hypothetical protein
MADNNLKGWIGFLIVVIIVIGGAFGTSHLIKSPTSAVSITSIGTNITSASDYNTTSSILNVSISPSTTSINVSVNFTTTTPGAVVNYSVVSPSIFNQSSYDSFYNTSYAQLFHNYSQNFNSSYNKTYKGKSSYNLSKAYSSNLSAIQANASSNASAEAYSNTTYSFITPFTSTFSEKAKSSKGQITFNLKLNYTAISLMKKGQERFIKIDLYKGATGFIGYIELYRP